jgi:hypothetical protein
MTMAQQSELKEFLSGPFLRGLMAIFLGFISWWLAHNTAKTEENTERLLKFEAIVAASQASTEQNLLFLTSIVKTHEERLQRLESKQ